MIKITRSNLDYNFYITDSSYRDYGVNEYYFTDDGFKYLIKKSGEAIPVISENLSSYYRAKKSIREYACNNDFNYFITITFDNRKVDISNELLIQKKICKYFNNFKNRYDSNFKYVIVAERGKKTKRLHFHGLVYLTNTSKLTFVGRDKKTGYLNYREEWLFQNFGRTTFIPINSFQLDVVNYVCKYITKDSYLSHVYKFNYFCSHGLKKSKVVYDSESLHNKLDSNVVMCLISWLSSNNLIVDYQFCSHASIPISLFTDFLSLHNLTENDFYKQLSFSDLV